MLSAASTLTYSHQLLPSKLGLVALGVDELYAAKAIERRSSAGEPFNMKSSLARRFHRPRSATAVVVPTVSLGCCAVAATHRTQLERINASRLLGFLCCR